MQVAQKVSCELGVDTNVVCRGKHVWNRVDGGGECGSVPCGAYLRMFYRCYVPTYNFINTENVMRSKYPLRRADFSSNEVRARAIERQLPEMRTLQSGGHQFTAEGGTC